MAKIKLPERHRDTELPEIRTPSDTNRFFLNYSCECDDTEDTPADPCPRRNLHRAEHLGDWALGVIRDDPRFRLGDHQELPDAAYEAARVAAHFALLWMEERR